MNKTFLRVCSLIMVLGLILTAFTACKKDKEFDKTSDVVTTEGETTEEVTEPLGTDINPLTGESGFPEEAQGKRPVAIMVENHPDARPQWGLSTPDVVIEGLVEGGITRMMWLYADPKTMPEKVGPVRSARHDYVEIADGMNALYMHCGGSNIADAYMPEIGMDDIDAVTAYGFKRDSSRKAPHNLVIDSETFRNKLADGKKDMTQTKEDWTPFKFSGDTRVSFGEETGSCNVVRLTFSKSYRHAFKYNADEKVYYNYMNDAEMKDGNNDETMKVTNVIIMYAPAKVCDDKGHMDWDMASGDAVYISNGYGESISYKKEGKREPLKFYGKDGKELTINKGKTWIGVVPETNRNLTSVE